MIRMVEKYVDHIISYPDCSQLLTRDYTTNFFPLDIQNIKYNNVINTKPIVVHAPTHDEYKGTSFILKAIERLKDEGYEFDFRLFRNTPNAEVRETLTTADIAIDQLFAFSASVFALESMAAGCTVLGGNNPEFSGFPRELPIIHTDPDNIYDNLKMVLEHPDMRLELGERGREYVEKYHDVNKIVEDILGLLVCG